MDKVKDFLKVAVVYQFWILLSLALLLPIWGWWSTTNDLLARTKDRTAKIDASYKSLPKAGEKNPNENWIDEVKKSNEKLDSGLKEAWKYLYQRQQQFKVWPKELQDFGFSDPEKANDFDFQRYSILYPKEVELVWKIVNKVGDKSLELSGPVIFPRERMPRASWANGIIPPTSDQMKGAQEDLWLLASLLRSIQRVNGGAKTPLKAAVREIQDIRLRGGSLAAAGGAPAAAGPGEGMGPAGRMRGEDMGGGGGAPAPAAADMQAGFDPGEEMGPDPEKGGGARAAMEGDGPGGRMGMGGPAPAEPAAARRYLEELPQARKRGFYLQVVIDQSKLPELLAQLSNSEWPVRILHVNMAERNPDSLVPPGDDALPPAQRLAILKGGAGNAGLPPQPGLDLGPRAMGVPAPAADEGRAAAMADPYLAVAAVSGYIVIYNPPPAETQNAEQSGGAPPAAGIAPAPAAAGNPPAPAANNTAAPPAAAAIKGTPTPSAPAASGTDAKTGGPAKTPSPPAVSVPPTTPPVNGKAPAPATSSPAGPPAKLPDPKAVPAAPRK